MQDCMADSAVGPNVLAGGGGAEALADTLANLDDGKNIALLETLNDIDDGADLARWRSGGT